MTAPETTDLFEFAESMTTGPKKRLYEDFLGFHRENPQVMQTLILMARKLKAKGKDRYSIKGLFEVLRYDHESTTSGEPFKLNNNATAYYARAIMDTCPDLKGFFETRKTRALH